ncbi:TIGR04149 family rSAM-modified RiPP [Lascolabacillus massiliensis]|jgi:natural product precursor|uniref:TIGR04149 family rSAM-modified RiPP n=1 Tax=Lascolabacillus massiliensis TaxID=1627894 RepID=UPI0006B35507|nr:TIGR04149 family rSAM-modified RiPP [Lascolabacillus massiliensis]
MKTLSKLKLQNAVVLENREMMAIYGGSGGSGSLCPDDKPYWIRCSNGNAGCCKYDDVVKCCGS